MIELPTRSVTRFFIPMIDVLTLLFCIYLLMPIVGQPGDPSAVERARLLQQQVAQLKADLARKSGAAGDEAAAKMREELDRLRKEKIETLRNRLAVRVLEVDGKDGRLYYRDPEQVEIRDQADAHQLIERDRKAQGVTKRELYYLLLFPRAKASAYPTVEQSKNYERWFEGVALGYDVPGAAPGKEK